MAAAVMEEVGAVFTAPIPETASNGVPFSLYFDSSYAADAIEANVAR